MLTNLLLQLEVSGDWSIKVQALVRRIRYLAENAPEEKSLVFSQFPDALKLVALALAANNIQHVQLIGGKLVRSRAAKKEDGTRRFLYCHPDWRYPCGPAAYRRLSGRRCGSLRTTTACASSCSPTA